MAINRTWWNNLVDDTGTGTTGTVWNKAAIAGLLDAIDAMFEPIKPWTPTDASGAGLVLGTAQGSYQRADKTVFFQGVVGYPTNSSGSSVKVGGLPYPANANNNANGVYITYANFGQAVIMPITAGSQYFEMYGVDGVNKNNTFLSGKAFTFAGFYFIL